MSLRHRTRAAWVTLSLSATLSANAASLAVLLTGHAAEPENVRYEAVARTCAQQLGHQIRVLYAEDSDLRYQQDITALVKAPPDLALVEPGWHDTGWVVRTLHAAGVPVATIREAWHPDTPPKGWLGDWSPDDAEGGYQLAVTLAGMTGSRPAAAIALTGPRLDPLSRARQRGLHRAQEAGHIRIHEMLTAHWQETEAQRLVTRAVQYFPDTQLIWAANDAMALGAMEATLNLKPRPKTGGIGASPWALSALEKGHLDALMVSRPLDAANAVISAHRWLSHLGGPLPALKHWTVLTARQGTRLRALLRGQNWSALSCREPASRKVNHPLPPEVLAGDSPESDPVPADTDGS